jgi:iron complex transport system substrate-binding protein
MKFFVFFTILALGFLSVQYGFNNVPHQAITTKSYERVVSLAPSMTETMRSLNQHYRLVGITIQCQDEELNHVAKIGSFSEPNYEAIIAQKPDLVLVVPHVMAASVIDRLIKNQVPVFTHQPDSLEDIKYITTQLAQLFNIKEKGYEIIKDINKATNNSPLNKTNISSKDSLIIVSASPLVVASNRTFVGAILQKIGLKNQAAESTVPWPIWPLENLILQPPSLLLLTNPADMTILQQTLNKVGVSLDKIKIIYPNRHIFNSPSPLVIKDIAYLESLLLD